MRCKGICPVSTQETIAPACTLPELQSVGGDSGSLDNCQCSVLDVSQVAAVGGGSVSRSPESFAIKSLLTVFALAVMEYAVGVSKFGKNPMTL